MLFYSTQKQSREVDFKHALFSGLAPDGGLYMPQTIPQISREDLAKVKTVQDSAYLVMRKWLSNNDIPDDTLKSLLKEAFSFPITLVHAGDFSVLELFHGPTMAFKDIAAGVLARLFEYYLMCEDKTATILVATSGDTGGAIAQAFSGMRRVNVVVLYPVGKVSQLQEEQLTRVGENVLSLAVNGSFDDCQAFVKKAFRDPSLEKLQITSANSINIGRLLPQIIYYVWAFVRSEEKKVRFVVPSGNMGNATAAVLAWKMGLPIDSLLIATNENDVAARYYQTGVYTPKKSVQTLSTAMDIGSPNNFERILSLFHNDHKAFREFITAIKISDHETVETIQKVFKKYQYVLDFHTAVGYRAAEKVSSLGSHTIVVSTASPLKFAKEMKEKAGLAVDNTMQIEALQKKAKHVIQAANNYDEIKRIILKNLS